MNEIQLGAKWLIPFVLADVTGAEVAGLDDTFVVAISKNGGAFVAGVGDKTEIGSGWYSYDLTMLETDTAGPLIVKVTGAGVVQQNLLYQVTGYAVQTLSGHDYCTLAMLKSRAGITDNIDDADLAAVIDGVSREIENDTQRRFWTTDADEVRCFTALGGDVVMTGDLISVTTLETDEAGNRSYGTTWTTVDYDFSPENADLEGRPFTRIEVTPNNRLAFPTSRRGVKVTGKFGYSATVPAIVREACLLQCERIFKRKDAPFGIVGSPDTGYVRLKAELDPDVQRFLDGVRKSTL